MLEWMVTTWIERIHVSDPLDKERTWSVNKRRLQWEKNNHQKFIFLIQKKYPYRKRYFFFSLNWIQYKYRTKVDRMTGKNNLNQMVENLISNDQWISWNQLCLYAQCHPTQTFPSCSLDSPKLPCFCGLVVGSELRRSFPPGFVEALLYQIIPNTAMIIPRTTCKLRPSFPKNKNPMINTSIVFIWPSTWKDTAVNLPMQMNWLRLVPTAIVHDRIRKICRSKHRLATRGDSFNFMRQT